MTSKYGQPIRVQQPPPVCKKSIPPPPTPPANINKTMVCSIAIDGYQLFTRRKYAGDVYMHYIGGNNWASDTPPPGFTGLRAQCGYNTANETCNCTASHYTAGSLDYNCYWNAEPYLQREPFSSGVHELFQYFFSGNQHAAFYEIGR